MLRFEAGACDRQKFATCIAFYNNSPLGKWPFGRSQARGKCASAALSWFVRPRLSARFWIYPIGLPVGHVRSVCFPHSGPSFQHGRKSSRTRWWRSWRSLRQVRLGQLCNPTKVFPRIPDEDSDKNAKGSKISGRGFGSSQKQSRLGALPGRETRVEASSITERFAGNAWLLVWTFHEKCAALTWKESLPNTAVCRTWALWSQAFARHLRPSAESKLWIAVIQAAEESKQKPQGSGFWRGGWDSLCVLRVH